MIDTSTALGIILLTLYILSPIITVTLLTIICIDIKKMKNRTNNISKRVNINQEKKRAKEKIQIFNNEKMKILIKNIVICGIIALLYLITTLIFKDNKYQKQNQIIGYIVLGTIVLLQIITIIYSIIINKKAKEEKTHEERID